MHTPRYLHSFPTRRSSDLRRRHLRFLGEGSMDIWAIWLDSILRLLGFLSSEVGLGLGFAIVAATLLLRTAILPISDRKSTRLNSSHPSISYAVFCLKKKIH